MNIIRLKCIYYTKETVAIVNRTISIDESVVIIPGTRVVKRNYVIVVGVYQNGSDVNGFFGVGFAGVVVIVVTPIVDGEVEVSLFGAAVDGFIVAVLVFGVAVVVAVFAYFLCEKKS